MIGQKICKQLDNRSLENLKRVSKSWNGFINQNKVIWKRKLQMYERNHTEFKEDWNLVIAKTPVETIKQLTNAVEDFYTFRASRLKFQFSPLHIFAERGILSLYEFAYGRVKNKNPKRFDGVTPYHLAAQEGRLQLCQFIIRNIEDKNPVTARLGWTPLHHATKNNHFEISKLIIENVDEPNPKTNNGKTVLVMAAENDSIEICSLVIEKLKRNEGKKST